MIGWRGASRYYTPQFKPAFELECLAIKKVREEMKLTNLKAMVPFCRTIKEAEQVIKIIADNGLDSPTSMAAAIRTGCIGLSGEFGGGARVQAWAPLT